MPQYKVKHQGQVKTVNFDGTSPTKAELRALLEEAPDKPTFGYDLPKPDKIPNPNTYYKKDWLDKIDPGARKYERPDRNMFTVDLSQATNRAVDRVSQSSDDANENKWKAQKLGFVSGASEAALNMLGTPETVLTAAPRMFRQTMADYPGHSINPRASAELVPVGEEQAYNSSFPKNPAINTKELGYENVARNKGRANDTFAHLYDDQTGAIGKNIRHDKRGHISGRFIKKDQPIEPDSFDIESSKPYEPEQIDYVKQMLDSLKLADEQKKLLGLSPKRKK